MGELIRRLGGSVYVDANIVIYAIEGFARYAKPLKALLEAMDCVEIRLVTSELTIAEVLVKPKQEKRPNLERAYLNFLQPSPVLELIPVDQTILIDAAQIRATSRLKLPDAIHAASAVRFNCDSFLTNDSRFAGIARLRPVLLSSLDLP